jgi:ABC-type spermidine/putrescine transport system permease subunit I
VTTTQILETAATPETATDDTTSGRQWSAELGRRHGVLLALPFIALAAGLVVYPFIRLVQIAFGGDDPVGELEQFFDNKANLTALRTTVVMSLIVTALSLVTGAIVAWSLRTSRSRLMKLFLLAAVTLPFWMGAVIKQYAWSAMLRSNGIINSALMELGIVDQPVDLLYTRGAVVIGMVYQMLPYAVLPAFAAFSTIDLNLVSAAESLGASRIRALASVVLPLAAPGLFATATVVFVICTGFYLTPVILGGMSTPFAATLIHQNVFVFYNLEGAALLSLALILVAVVVVVVGVALVGARRLQGVLG